ncbi:MAG: hypothetical protein JXR76_22665 [Deltaproteobacteria bacterium]|nr:hypothetical protein [Deltaproteobacteria bacterium]
MNSKIRLITLILPGIALLGCHCVDGSGNIEKRTAALSLYDKVNIDVSATVVIRKGSQSRVTI